MQLWKFGHHLLYSHGFFKCRYTSIALFERLTSKYRLFLDLDFISRDEHSQDGYALGFEEPETNL